MAIMDKSETLGWVGIFRLGLVQAALGAIVVLTTSTLNRVMVVELALPAVLPGALVGWHYAVQMSRPRWGYGSDMGGSRTPWILGGIVALALGAVGAACSVALMADAKALGIAAAFLSFFVIGIGVGAAGTNLLALLATQTAPARKAAAAAIAWIMMIFGFVVTAGVAGAMLDPFTMAALIRTTAIVCAGAILIAALAIWGVEKKNLAASATANRDQPAGGFREAFAEIWAEGQARRFTIFVFVSMLAFSAQDLILEPFAGLIYGYTPGESTALSGVQNGGVLLGMILTAVVGTTIGKSRAGFMRNWTIAGCIASALALAGIASAAMVGPSWPLQPTVFALGLANGAFAVAAIGSMMTLASAGREGREGIRMGLWGASQAVAFAIGGFLGAVALDVARLALPEIGPAFALVFAAEGALFILAAMCAARVGETTADDMRLPAMPSAELVSAE
ncbi:MAG: BCD family MFS transporter [Pseudomonadota bacterium]